MLISGSLVRTQDGQLQHRSTGPDAEYEDRQQSEHPFPVGVYGCAHVDEKGEVKMSEQSFDDLFDDEGNLKPEADDSNVPKALRDYAKAQTTRAKQLEEELAGLRKEQRENSVKQFVKDKGLDERVAKFIGDEDPEKWFEENGALFAAANAGSQGTEETDEADNKPTGEPALSAEQIAALQGVLGYQQGSFTPGTDEELNAKLDRLYSDPNMSESERHAQLRAMGAMG